MADVPEHAPQLVREVELPGREHSGIAAILVAASALTFALAGSAFALWARTTTHCQHQHHIQYQSPVHATDATNGSDAEPDRCVNTVQHVAGPEASALYRLCPDQSTVTPANKVLVEEHEGMVVFRIID